MNELQQLWADLKRHPAFLITLIVVVIVILVYVYNQNQNSTTATTGGTQPVEIDNISFTPPASTGTIGTTSGTGTTSSSGHQPGTTFTGPTGVKHYVTTGSETLAQIAQKLGLSSYSVIYNIKENHTNGWVPNGLTATKASSYKPPSGVPIVY